MAHNVVVRPGVGMLALFPSMSYKPWYAIGEFVDNALQSWRSNHEALRAAYDGRPPVLKIDVDIDRDRGAIVVIDNAAGIATADVDRAFTPAAPPADSSGLSQFGIGMKSAACWYAQHFVVTSTALGEPVRRTVTFDVPRIVDSEADTLPVVERPAPAGDHGTQLILTRLNQSPPSGRTLGKIRAYLRSIYRTFLEDEDIHLVVGGERLRPERPPLLTTPRWSDPGSPAVEWRKEMDVVLPSGRRVSGWAGLLAKGSTSKAGFALLYRGKVVQGAGAMAQDPADAFKPPEIFGQGNTFRAQRLVGEFDVSEIKVTHTKDALVWDGEDEEAFLGELKERADAEPLPLLRQADNYRATERNRSVQSTVRSVVESVAHVVARSEREVPFDHDGHGTGFEHDDDDRSGGSSEHASPPVEQRVETSETELQVQGDNLVIRVVDEPTDARRWLRVERSGDDWVISLNRAHRFTESFAYLPGMDLEPILRLGVAVALAQIHAQRSGVKEPRFFVAALNRLLAGPLAERTDVGV
ncbi:ATP-binding protein [Isoptericola sp. b408]|uniref:ATP-binding protein n=1 Tax=Isoptericola sp. b408 TaxID=3064653 RepID=UPI0027127C13|nr:ATP-binding protein [Isoptericola sp. b408]MDO8150202.1 ATP-binding protein [Isoptericola sp. b408]